MDDTNVQCETRDPALLTHLAYPYSHTRKTRRAIGLPDVSVQNVTLAAASSSTTASAYVIRPDRDMRQFDGSIV